MTEMQIFIDGLLQVLVAGLLVGTVYGLMCVGLAMIFGIMRVINFAQGDFMMAGMYVAYFAFTLIMSQLVGVIVGPYLAILVMIPVMFALGWAAHIGLISRVSGARSSKLDGDGHYAQLILTLGISLILQNGAMMLFGSGHVGVRTPLSSSAWIIGPLSGDYIEIFINKARLISAALALVVLGVIATIVGRTMLGKALRAAADNPAAATYMGIDVDRAHRVAFAMGVTITAIAGALIATNYPIHPFVGLEFVIIMYAGVVLGGVGSIHGAFLGGLIIGLVQQLSTLVLSPQLQNAAIFVFFLLIVLLRPQGLFGRVSERT